MSEGADDIPALLNQILERLERLEDRSGPIGHLAERVPLLTEAVSATASRAWDAAERGGVDPAIAIDELNTIALLAARPEQLQTLRRLVELAPTLQPFLDHPEALEKLGEILNQIDPADLNALLTQLGKVGPALAAHAASPEFEDLLDAFFRKEAPLKLASAAGTAMVEAQAEPIQPAGAFGAFFRMGDPDIQRALGLILAIAKRFGQKLR